MRRSSATPSGFFALRTPLLPIEVLRGLSADLRAPCVLAEGGDLDTAVEADRSLLEWRLRTLVADPAAREALFVASPSFDEALGVWLARPDDPRARRVPEILIRYVARMAARPTPFGLFSGCTVGAIGPATRLELASRSAYRRHTRLDMHYLVALSEALQSVPEVRAALSFRPSNGLHATAGELRYAEARIDPTTRERSYRLVSVDRTPHLDAALERCASGARPAELVDALVALDKEVTRDEAEGYVMSLIESQILTSDLAPAVTGDEPLSDLLKTLREHGAGSAASAVLASTDRAIRALDAEGLGHGPERYRAVAEGLASLPVDAEITRLFQVDLYKPAARAELGGFALDEIKRAAELLARITPPIRNAALERFREAFAARYGERLEGSVWERRLVSLAEALDEESGIGFEGSSEPSPLLDGLAFPPPPTPRELPFGAREERLLRGLVEAMRSSRTEWALDEDDVEALSKGGIAASFPDAFAVLATIGASSPDALVRGDFRVHVHGVSGPSGAVLLGRFCHGDGELLRAVRAHVAAEEATRPDAIFAEIVHLPDGRLGNILCRPMLREHEIPFHARPGVAPAAQIPISDLRLTLSEGRLVLVSARHAREVIPRLTSAHNDSTAALGVYRFLCALQHERDARRIGWSWGALESAPFLPRVTSGRLVLSPARWNLSSAELASLKVSGGAAAFHAVQALRARIGLPRWVGLADGDNVLPIDLESALHVDSFAHLVRGREAAPLIELFVDETVVEGPEGRFAHEVVVPFVTNRACPPARVAFAAGPRPDARLARTFAPGSGWLYAKLFCGTGAADVVLREVVRPLVDAAREAKAVGRWFFIRYGDPEWHLRLRFEGSPKELTARVMPLLREATDGPLRDGRVARLQLDTYEREIERYGGEHGIDLAEALFEADSDAVLSIVERLDGDEGLDARWRLALLGMHLLLVDLGLDLAGRTAVARGARARFGAEHRVDGALVRQLGAKFREERAALEELLAGPTGSSHRLAPGFEVFAERSARIAPLCHELRARERAGRLALPVHRLAPSYLHMHANRLLRSEHRAQELVLYDFLLRLYESEGARVRPKSA